MSEEEKKKKKLDVGVKSISDSMKGKDPSSIDNIFSAVKGLLNKPKDEEEEDEDKEENKLPKSNAKAIMESFKRGR